MKQETTLQTVSRAIEVLRCFKGGSLDLSLKELTQKMELNKVTVLRLARTLVKEGLMVHDSRTGLYRLSFGCIGLARKLLDRDGLFDCAQSYMEEARKKSNETVCLIVREEWNRVVTHTFPSFQATRYVLEIGDRRPIYMGASGYCFMSRMPDDQLEKLLRTAEDGSSPNMVDFSSDQFRTELETVRKNGWAIRRSEWDKEAAGASASIIAPDGEVRAIIGIVVPLSRASNEHMESCAKIALEAATKTSDQLFKQHQ